MTKTTFNSDHPVTIDAATLINLTKAQHELKDTLEAAMDAGDDSEALRHAFYLAQITFDAAITALVRSTPSLIDNTTH